MFLQHFSPEELEMDLRGASDPAMKYQMLTIVAITTLIGAISPSATVAQISPPAGDTYRRVDFRLDDHHLIVQSMLLPPAWTMESDFRLVDNRCDGFGLRSTFVLKSPDGRVRIQRHQPMVLQRTP